MNNLADQLYLNESAPHVYVSFDASAYVGSFQTLWDYILSDLRNKVIYRSLPHFSECLHKAMHNTPTINTYEALEKLDDEQLVWGAYYSGVIGWQARRVLSQAATAYREAPEGVRTVVPMPANFEKLMENCIEQVKDAAFPMPLVSVEDYFNCLESPQFHRDMARADSELCDLPCFHRSALAHKIYGVYIKPRVSRTLRANIEFIAPLLWQTLPKDVKAPLTNLMDIDSAWSYRADLFNRMVEKQNLPIKPLDSVYMAQLIESLCGANERLDVNAYENDQIEQADRIVRLSSVMALSSFARNVPAHQLKRCIGACIDLYLGEPSSRLKNHPTSGHLNLAAVYIPCFFERLPEGATTAFIAVLMENKSLQKNLLSPMIMRRFRVLANCFEQKRSGNYLGQTLLKVLCNERNEPAFFALLEEAVKEH